MDSVDAALIKVEVAYAKAKQQVILEVIIKEGSNVGEAIIASDILQRFPEIDLTQNKIGIFSKPTKQSTVLREHDRIEIYRPLIADPKEVRKQRAAEGKVMRKGGDTTTEK